MANQELKRQVADLQKKVVSNKNSFLNLLLFFKDGLSGAMTKLKNENLDLQIQLVRKY